MKKDNRTQREVKKDRIVVKSLQLITEQISNSFIVQTNKQKIVVEKLENSYKRNLQLSFHFLLGHPSIVID